MQQTLEPIDSAERIQSLDVLRGFSLLGIFLINMISFHSPFSYYNPYEWWKYGDLTVFTWLDILVQGSFYPIFAMMFGYGMVIMMQRSKVKNVSFWKISVRRLLILLLFGVFHAFLIWYGDILITYAVMGLVLLLFLRISGPILISIGAILYILPQLFIGGMLILASLFDSASLADFYDIVGLQQSAETYANGSFLEITAQRFADWSVNNNLAGFLLYLFMILPLMMVGAGAAKLHWLQKANRQKKKWLLILMITLPLGLAAKMLPFFLETSLSIQYIQDTIGGPILAVAYVAIIVLLMSNRMIAKLFKPFASAGRMSITIYLSQSLIGTMIFYNYGLGLYGQMSMATGTLLAVAIFAIQVMVAEIWLTKFKYGPVEKLWRLLTYGR
ncbi:DUF418 domain-containing protein [Lederbergia citrea]|uniref:DUF418 domain-containing protein n=1 Tax=Lederbergia citrea TaxID=2833581 RepID=A0A942Z3F5_9BACI|nr:DUF418 domain-containing protein [Lederbergia citrea]MBS4177427.1 DUF418 domain-containing protein [Lederbergia citrea]MBS4204105.1 DUF418 domain-containing protein [Lederbergia citrea]MBS4221310.1 DUF418 domain-containing protein [Lederbergia citrea]